AGEPVAAERVRRRAGEEHAGERGGEGDERRVQGAAREQRAAVAATRAEQRREVGEGDLARDRRRRQREVAARLERLLDHQGDRIQRRGRARRERRVGGGDREARRAAPPSAHDSRSLRPARAPTSVHSTSTRKMIVAYAAAMPYRSPRSNAQRYASVAKMSVLPPGRPSDTR